MPHLIYRIYRSVPALALWSLWLFHLACEPERPVPGEIGQMPARDAAQGKVIVNPESLTVFHGELRREEYRAIVRERNQSRAASA